MKALFLAENYHWFYNRYWETHPEIRELDFATCCRRMFDEFFYQSDSHAAGLRCLGHEAITLVPDCIPLQLKWAREHGLWMPPYRRESMPFPDRLVRLATGSVSYRDYWHTRILAAQLRYYQPDVVQVFSGVRVSVPMLRRLRLAKRKWVCQWACRIQDDYPFSEYDQILTTATNFMEEFQRRGNASCLVQHAFDERIDSRLEAAAETGAVLFIGSFSPHHERRRKLLEEVAQRIPLDVYGEGREYLPSTSPLQACWRGSATFGLEMYRLCSRYRIVLHVPGDAGWVFAGAKRLFEVTGTGSMLLTSMQPGLEKYFDIGREIDAFRDAAEAAEKIRYYLDHDKQRRNLAAAGRRRTLRDHVYSIRMKEWLDAVA